MTTKDVIQHLEQAQRDATEDKAIVEISQSELDQITGAGRDEVAKYEFKKRF